MLQGVSYRRVICSLSYSESASQYITQVVSKSHCVVQRQRTGRRSVVWQVLQRWISLEYDTQLGSRWEVVVLKCCKQGLGGERWGPVGDNSIVGGCERGTRKHIYIHTQTYGHVYTSIYLYTHAYTQENILVRQGRISRFRQEMRRHHKIKIRCRVTTYIDIQISEQQSIYQQS